MNTHTHAHYLIPFEEERSFYSSILFHYFTILYKEELWQHLKEPIVLEIYKKGTWSFCSNYRGVSHLSTSYKILSNVLPLRLTQCILETFSIDSEIIHWSNLLYTVDIRAKMEVHMYSKSAIYSCLMVYLKFGGTVNKISNRAWFRFWHWWAYICSCKLIHAI